jgi:hypothetical protein
MNELCRTEIAPDDHRDSRQAPTITLRTSPGWQSINTLSHRGTMTRKRESQKEMRAIALARLAEPVLDTKKMVRWYLAKVRVAA